MQRRTFQTALGFALTLAAISVPQMSLAQAWPTKQPIKLVAVFPPGGSVDQVVRIIAQPLQQQLGQTVIVENRGGASGVIGTAAVVQAPADGYTFAVVFDTHGVNPSLNPNMPFDTKKDLTPLVLVGTSPMVLATYVNSEYKTFADVKVHVVGFADDESNEALNRAISLERAKSVRAFFKAQGLRTTALTYEGRGSDEKQKAQHFGLSPRRVEVEVAVGIR